MLDLPPDSRENCRGYLWQGRFASFPMDEKYLLKAAMYVELIPVKAKMVTKTEDYRWSSVHAHLKGSRLRLTWLIQAMKKSFNR